jgi:hypothetical protein
MCLAPNPINNSNDIYLIIPTFQQRCGETKFHYREGFSPNLFSLSSLFLQRKMIRIIIKGVMHIKHHQPLLFMSCNLLDITAKDGRIVKGLYITVNSPTSS